MGNQISIIYKGEEIWFNERDDVWTWSGAGLSPATSKSLKAVKEKVNAALREAFAGCSAFLYNGWSGAPSIVEVTSRDEEDREFWIAHKKGTEKGRRAKASQQYLYAFDAHNRALIARLEAAMAERDGANKKFGRVVEEVKGKLHPFDPPDLDSEKNVGRTEE